MNKFLSSLLFLFTSTSLFAQMPTNGLDVQHYDFYIRLNDSNNVVQGKAIITTAFIKPVDAVIFDLVNKKSDGKGMMVKSVIKDGIRLSFSQDADHVVIKDNGMPGKKNRYTIEYSGIPADGLVISNNRYGARTFFGDNWPNRAHNWIPCNDHLSDKATVDFYVTAPAHYQVISNGKKIEETNLPNQLKLTHWREAAPLPVKVMVIGVAEFAVDNFAQLDCIPVSTWVYPNDRDSGFAQYSIAAGILQWFINHVGPYPFEKLANVQSTTIFGGMENAGCIFYFEKSIYSKSLESLMAHEIAHQWFGDYITEIDWPHLWLSEGFATYMTDLYLEDKYGKDSLKNLLRTQRAEVIAYSKDHSTPVVDTSASHHLMNLLNDNSYQKGAWVLHMLRRKTGDSLFWKAIRLYYKTYAAGNASTADLRKTFEEVSHQDLGTFFRQWLHEPGLPELKINWTYNKLHKEAEVSITQAQNNLFAFLLAVRFSDEKNTVTKTIEVKDRETQKKISLNFEPTQVIVDPDVDLLFGLE
ncbi:MAG: M1 family metallopeptidase [Ginsengibacter sp.]